MKCSFTGHRIIPEGKIEFVKREIRREIEQAVGDGFTFFLSGFANGADLMFAAVVADIKKDNPDIILEAAIPYRERLKNRDETYIAERLARLRTQMGVSARDMSLSIGQANNYISNIENGKSSPSIQGFFYICEYLKISPKDFFDEGNNNPAILNELIDMLS
jgi:DNA-binding XRE family transcriptional regulator